MSNVEKLRDELIRFLRERLGDLYDWQPPKNTEPLGPQKPEVFNFFETQTMALLAAAASFAAEFESEINSQNGLGLMQVNLKFRDRFGTKIDDIRNSLPQPHAGGFGAFFDEEAYQTFCSMQYWTREEAVWLSLGLVPKPEQRQPAIKCGFKEQEEFARRRNELFQRHWPDAEKEMPTITPPDFCRWALEKQVECPSFMFECVAKSHKTKLASRVVSANEHVKDDFGGRERATLQKILIGMALKHYQYDPTAGKSTVPARIESTLHLQGLDVTAETIRKHLKSASVHLEAKEDDQSGD